MADIRINALPLETSPTSSEFLAIDGASTRKTTIQSAVNAASPVASQAQAQTGTDNNARMTPLSTKQSIASEVGVTVASKASGDLANTAVQPTRTITAGSGLTGGGTLSSDLTINVGAGFGIDVQDDSVGLTGSVQSRLIPSGGNTGQVLSKASSSNYDLTWSAAGSGDVVGPASSTAGNLAAFFDATGKVLKQQILSSFAATILDDTSGAAMFATMGATSWGSGNNRGVKLPDGTIFQWGKLTVTGGNASATFPQAFPSICYIVVASNATEGSDGVTTYTGWADVWNVTGFAARGRFTNSGGTGAAGIDLAYFAVGR